jgi:hypothetical protein
MMVLSKKISVQKKNLVNFKERTKREVCIRETFGLEKYMNLNTTNNIPTDVPEIQ